jgi:hypothetical protein
LAATGSKEAEGQAQPASLPVLASGVFKPGPAKVAGEKRVSHSYLSGMLTAGNLRLEMHETTQEAGAPHEPIGTHLHNELWLVREGDGGADNEWEGPADGGGRRGNLRGRGQTHSSRM